jgi:hypothetical protein
VPLGVYIGARLREGKLPQWYPYEGLGEPFIGQLNESAFHPASWLFAILPGPSALRWDLLLGYLAAGLGQLLLARRLGMSLTASALAAVVFAFSGYAISLSNLLPYLWGMASLPWLGLFAAEVTTRDRPWPWVAALALCWASIVVAGDSHSALLGGLVVLFVAALTRGLRRLPLCVLASLLALGIAAAELLPAIDIVKAGPRALWNSASNIRLISAFWALHPYRLPELLFAGWIPFQTSILVSNERYHEGGVWALSIFVGAPAVALASVGLFSRSQRGFLAGTLAIFGLWLALGYQGGLEPALRHALPILNLLRYPEKHLAVWTFGLSLASAAGLDHLRGKQGWKVPIALATLGAACVAAALALPADLPLRIWPQLAAAPLHVPRLHGAWHAALLATGAALAASAAILVGARFRPAAIALLPLAVFLELWVTNGATIGVAPASVLVDTPRLCSSARRAGAGADGLRVVSASSRSRQADELERAAIWAAMSRNLLQPDSSALCGIGSVSGWPILSNEPRVLREVIGRADRHPVLQLYGFGLLVRAFPEDRPVPDEVVVDAVSLLGKGLVLVKRPAAPRAYAATPRWVPDAAAARGEVERQGLSLVETPVLVGVGEPFTGGTGPVGTVRIAAYEPEHVAIEARMERAGAVILNDLDASGWTATVDGARARIYNANALVRGVLVPPGAHRIEMSYALPRLREGLVVSGASLLLCAGLALAGKGRRKRVTAVS